MAMTREEMLENIARESEVSDMDTVGFYLDNAEEIILHQLYPYDEFFEDEATPPSIPARYDRLRCRLAVYLINKRGAEGEIVHMENGIHRHYQNSDVPTSMMSEIIPKAVAI